jgi:osmoprotectant transport system permease protein
MDIFAKALDYAAGNSDKLVLALRDHLLLVVVPLAIGLGLGLPLGLLSSRSRAAATVLINSFNALRVIPSLAILFVAIPYFGLTFTSAAIALTLLVMPQFSSVRMLPFAASIRQFERPQQGWGWHHGKSYSR